MKKALAVGMEGTEELVEILLVSEKVTQTLTTEQMVIRNRGKAECGGTCL